MSKLNFTSYHKCLILKNQNSLRQGLAKSGHFADLLDFNDGLITIQDESSQLVAVALDAQPADKILDTCAAPGGKTVHIAEYLSEQGHIEALDLYSQGAFTIRQNATRLHQAEKN